MKEITLTRTVFRYGRVRDCGHPNQDLWICPAEFYSEPEARIAAKRAEEMLDNAVKYEVYRETVTIVTEKL